jgi:Na+/H+ antiporter NhaD/arsenite permease-like protein
MVVALLIFALTLALLFARPRHISEGIAACVGAFLMLVTGQVSWEQVPELLRGSANILLFFLGLMVVSYEVEK